MENDVKELLNTLLVAQVLTLARTIEIQKSAKGSSSSDHYLGDAVKEIYQQRADILRRLAQSS